MSAEPSIQHKASFKNEAGFAYEDGERVPIVGAEIFTDEASASGESAQLAPPHLDASQLLETIIHGARDMKEIAARALVLAMLLKCESAPKTATEFSLALDIKRTTGQRLWARLSSICKGNWRFLGTGAHW